MYIWRYLIFRWEGWPETLERSSSTDPNPNVHSLIVLIWEEVVHTRRPILPPQNTITYLPLSGLAAGGLRCVILRRSSCTYKDSCRRGLYIWSISGNWKCCTVATARSVLRQLEVLRLPYSPSNLYFDIRISHIVFVYYSRERMNKCEKAPSLYKCIDEFDFRNFPMRVPLFDNRVFKVLLCFIFTNLHFKVTIHIWYRVRIAGVTYMLHALNVYHWESAISNFHPIITMPWDIRMILIPSSHALYVISISYVSLILENDQSMRGLPPCMLRSQPNYA